MFNSLDKNSWSAWAVLPLRLIIGFGFMAHGYAKLSAWTTALVELFGGLAIMAGVFVSIVSIPLIIIMLAAMFTVHLPFGFSAVKLIAMTANGAQFGTIGYEVNLLYIAGLLALVLGNPSLFSIDAILRPP